MPAEDHQADLAAVLDHELDVLPLDVLGSQHYEQLMGAGQAHDRRDPATIYLGRMTLRKPVMDLENEAARGPQTIGTSDLVPGGSDPYYEAKRRAGLITDERRTA